MKQNQSFSHVVNLLDELKGVPARDLEAGLRGREKFLSRVSHSRLAVSRATSRRQTGWIPWLRKETINMKPLIATFIAITLLVGSGITAVAAQSTLPNQPLYGTKILIEEIGTLIIADPSAKIERLMQLSQVRVQEIAALASQSEDIPEQVETRLQQHIEEALHLTAGQYDQDMQISLERIRTQLQIQEQTITQLQNQVGKNGGPILERTRLMLQERLRLAEEGLADPQQFRSTIQNRNRIEQTDTTPTPATSETPQATPTSNGGYGSNGTGTPMPNSNNDAGPNTTPAGGNSNGNNSGGGVNENGSGSDSNGNGSEGGH